MREMPSHRDLVLVEVEIGGPLEPQPFDLSGDEIAEVAIDEDLRVRAHARDVR